jgi:hypothetical protein
MSGLSNLTIFTFANWTITCKYKYYFKENDRNSSRVLIKYNKNTLKFLPSNS